MTTISKMFKLNVKIIRIKKIGGVIATPHAEYPDNMARLSSLRSVRLEVMLSNMVSFY